MRRYEKIMNTASNSGKIFLFYLSMQPFASLFGSYLSVERYHVSGKVLTLHTETKN